MKITSSTSLHEIRKLGLTALARELGPYGLLRFLQQYDVGSGDYTRDRHQWLGSSTVDEIASEVESFRKQRPELFGKKPRKRRAG